MQNPQPTVTSVSASWVVPSVTATISDTFSAVWVGIGGQFDTSLIQCGTEQDFINGASAYSAWYELLPGNAITIRSITVSPGDQIQAFVQLVDSDFNRWAVNVTDVTSGQSFQRTVVYGSSQLSAEWIVERPTVNRVVSPLANFGNVTIMNCTATIGSVNGGISSFSVAKVVMYSSNSPGGGSVQLADVSDFTPDGEGFTVTYLASS
jgi:hypothetical protein